MELSEETKIFLLESYENLDRVEQDLLALEKNPNNDGLLNGIFRSVHTIKGNSGFLGFSTLERVCHKGESTLDKLRSKQLTFNSDMGSVLLEFIDFVRSTLESIEQDGEDPNTDASVLLDKLSKY